MAETQGRQQRAERTRSHIIEVAAVAFAEHGYDGTSLNDMVKLSGVSKGAFYFHFSSKEELALATFEVKQQQMVGRLAAAGEELSGDAADRLSAMLRRRNRLLREDRSLGCVTRLGNELNARAVPGSGFELFHEIPIRLIAGLVREGQVTGELRGDLDAEAAAQAIFAWVVGIDTLSGVASAGKDLEERSEQMLALLVPALRTPGTAASRRKPRRSRP